MIYRQTLALYETLKSKYVLVDKNWNWMAYTQAFPSIILHLINYSTRTNIKSFEQKIGTNNRKFLPSNECYLFLTETKTDRNERRKR